MLDIFKNRFSVREYSSEVVSEQDLQNVLKAAQLAPTWKNKQCFDIVVVDDRKIMQAIGKATNHNPSESAYKCATYLLVFVADPSKSGDREDKPYYMSDCAIALEHAILQATALQLGTCWIGAFSEEKLSDILAIPKHLKIVGMTPLGYSNETYKQRPRRKLSQIVHRNKYQKFMQSPSDTFTLNNGVKIPCIGFGTWTLTDKDICISAVKAALDAGYTHIDTAQAYQNEAFIGEAIASSNISRKDIFITSKLSNKIRGYDETIAAIQQTLDDLQTDYLDLFLIHWPNPIAYRDNWKEMNAISYKAMEDMVHQGKIKALGISNFRKHHIDALMETAVIPPVINQIELHPGLLQESQVEYAHTHDMLIESYSPLGQSQLLDKQEFHQLEETYHKSTAQIILRWHIQKGHLPLPRSTNAKRIESNVNIFDFELSDKDMGYIDALIFPALSEDHDPDTATF